MSDKSTPQFLLIPLWIALVSGFVLLVLALPVQPLFSLIVGIILIAALLAARRAGLDVFTPALQRLRSLFKWDDVIYSPLPRWLLALELLLIAAMILIDTRAFISAGAGEQLSGGEAEWITSSVYAAHFGLRDYGRIPLWQPYLEFGEPLVDNPVSFILNPFSSVPSLLLGGEIGLRVSVVLAAALAGLGGWFMGRIAGFGPLGRVLLALLLLGKGNMHAMFNAGYFQLAASQAYFPWIIGGVLAIARFPGKRWPPVLTGLAAALLLLAGNIWYTLPVAICGGVVALTHWRKPSVDNTSLITRYTSFFPLPSYLLAILVALGVSAAYFIPVFANQNRIGNHPDLVEAGWIVPLWDGAARFYYTADPYLTLQVYSPEKREWTPVGMDRLTETYYSYIIPPWFAVLLFAIPLYRPRFTRLWWAAWVLLIIFTLWGAGGQPLFLWLYDTVPFLRGWRFVGRALAVGSFWIALLLAMRADGLWKILVSREFAADRFPPLKSWLRPPASVLGGLRYLLAGGLVAACLTAAWDVNRWWVMPEQDIINPIHPNDRCVSWLREQRPDDQLAVWQYGYHGTTTFLNNRVRIYDVLSDFEMSPLPNTLGRIDLTRSLPEFATALSAGHPRYLYRQGYEPMAGSPSAPLLPETPNGEAPVRPCVYHKPDALPYAYTVALSVLNDIEPPESGLDEFDKPGWTTLPPETVTPVTNFQRQPDNITLLVEGGADTVLTIQERAFPGWYAEIDGQPAQLESVGGQIGVILPADGAPHRIYFSFRPPLFLLGAVITLLTGVVCTCYLLRMDLRLKRRKN